MARRYHLLLASLPHLAHFERLKALPIGPRRFEGRLAGLDPADRAVLAYLRAALWPERRSKQFAGSSEVALPPSARALAERADEIRTLFRERRGEGDMVRVERDRLSALWAAGDRLTRPHGFDFDAVIRTVLRWDIASAWLAGDAVASRERISDLAGRLADEWSPDAAA